VIGFHEGASGLSGGFLGVDIFFVLSGFLITDLLVARYDRTGRLDLAGFWTRRARRLLPALAGMLVVVTAAATVIEPGQEASLRLALLAAGTYTSNWYQILHHVSYFAAAGQAGAPPPLDHLWSLAIEEQFYLAWPLIVWCVIVRLDARRARVTCALIGAAVSALVMAIQYTPGGDPSPVYYGTDTHASALLIGAALALAWPLRRLAAIPAEHTRRLDMAGIAGLVVLAWAAGHFSGSDQVVYPVGLLLAAFGAAALVAAAAGHGVISALTSWQPLRWVGVRSYGIYLWHWPVIALGTALVGPDTSSPWLWLAETGVTIALASASWRFIETPIMRNGLRATVRHWVQLVAEASRRPAAGTRGRAVPVMVAATAAITFVLACYGVARSPAPAAPSGLLRQVANGERVSNASQSTPAAPSAPSAPSASSAPSSSPAAGRAPAKATPTPAACHLGQPRVPGGQVTAVGDSVMLASAAALEAALPGAYINAKIDRQIATGLAVIRSLAAAGRLRHVVVVSLGTNGGVSVRQLRQLQRITGPGRELVLVSTYGPQAWEHAVNTALAAAARHGKHTELADWHQAIAGRTSLLWPDGIHPRPAGARLYARVVLAAIKAGLTTSQQPSCPPGRTDLPARHVHESRIVALERDRYSGGRAVPVLGNDQVRLASPRRLPLVRILAVKQDHNVAILFDTIVGHEAIGDEVVGALHGGVVDRLRSERFDADDAVPVEVAAGDLAQRLAAHCLRAAHQALS
jgi:peptidoglycan/LPS O-acetylase OafA/YrhL